MKVLRKFVCLLFALVVAAPLVAVSIVGAAGSDPGPRFTTHLFGLDEVPAVDAAGFGWSTWQVEGDELHYRVVVSGVEGEIVGIHLHQGRTGWNGPVVVPLDISIATRFDDNTAVLYEGVVTPADFMADLEGRGMAALIGAVEHESIYVNVHTSLAPSGALRGQLKEVVPPPTTTTTTTSEAQPEPTTTSVAPTTTVPSTTTSTSETPLPTLPALPDDAPCFGLGKPVVEFDNRINADVTITLRLTSDPTPIQHRVEANGTSTLFLAPGTYTVDASVDLPSVTDFRGVWDAEVGCTYGYFILLS